MIKRGGRGWRYYLLIKLFDYAFRYFNLYIELILGKIPFLKLKFNQNLNFSLYF